MHLPLLDPLVDLLFPPSCPACGRGAWERGPGALCAPCRARMPAAGERCPICARLCGPHRSGPGCPRCRGPTAERDALTWSGSTAGARRHALQGVVAACSYAGAARDLVLALKFRARLDAVHRLAALLVEALEAAGIPGDLVVPVPLSRARRRQRGYNQATVLARAVGSRLDLDVRPGALRRRRHTAPQTGRSRSARRRGPRGAFVARSRRVRDRSVLLVDDVLTTGATARACALALRRAGAAGVVAAVACRAERR